MGRSNARTWRGRHNGAVRNLLLVSGVALAVVISVTWYTASFIREFEDQKAEVQEKLEAVQGTLVATNARWPYRSSQTRLEPKRFAAYLAARTAAYETLAERHDQPDSRRGFNAKRARNAALRTLAAELTAQTMSIDEFAAIRDRFASILATDASTDLLREWRMQTSNAKTLPNGLPLPPAATDVTDAERQLIEKQKKQLVAGMGAELLELWYRPATTAGAATTASKK